jgi:hypothetical protein
LPKNISEEMDLALPNFLTASSPLVFGAAVYATGFRGLGSKELLKNQRGRVSSKT